MLVKNNKYIPLEDKDFFILLRIGLWQKVEEKLSSNPDWEYIYNLSIEQTVQGIVADGIGLYQKQHPDLNITQEENDKFLSASAQIVRRNFAINQLQAKICNLFNEQGIRYVVMKGQAVAQAYPKPMLRCSGDIDFFFDEANHQKAIEAVSPFVSYIEILPEKKHTTTIIDDIVVELHAEDSEVIGRKEVFKKLLYVTMQDRNFRNYDCNGTTVFLAPSTFDATYIFLHFCTHYYTSGLGLRQICDWVMLLNKEQNTIDKDKLKLYLQQFNLEKQWNLFLSFANNYLGLNEAVCTLMKQTSSYLKKHSGKEIWKQCKETGNFGHKEKKKIKPTSRIGLYKYSFIDTHAIARKQWGLSRKMAFSTLYTFYKHYATLFICKILHIGGQGFKKY